MNKAEILKIIESAKDIKSPFIQGKLLNVLLHGTNKEYVTRKVIAYLRKYPNSKIFVNGPKKGGPRIRNDTIKPKKALPKKTQPKTIIKQVPPKKTLPNKAQPKTTTVIPKKVQSKTTLPNTIKQVTQKKVQLNKAQPNKVQPKTTTVISKKVLPQPPKKNVDPKYSITSIPSGALRSGKVQHRKNPQFEKAFSKAVGSKTKST